MFVSMIVVSSPKTKHDGFETKEFSVGPTG